ncbi:MAG: phenylacetate--CoA ligase, partial [Arsenicicoccus sp.]
ERGIDPAGTSLQIGVFGAEPWTEAMRAEIEQRCGMHATDIFGLSEMMGPGVAQECVETKDGLTLWEDHFFPEIIDPITEEPVADGEEGELVLTAMTREAMLVLRYRTRDLTRLLAGTARPGMRRLAKITGRSDDLMIVRGVNVFPTQIEELVLGTPGLTPHFQCVLTRPGRMDQLTINVEGEPGLSGEDGQVKDRIGTTAQVVVLGEGGVERSVGKARRIVDQRDD